MRIEGHEIKTVHFKDLQPGDAFELCGEMFIKTSAEIAQSVKAVRLSDGLQRYVSEMEVVAPVSAYVEFD